MKNPKFEKIDSHPKHHSTGRVYLKKLTSRAKRRAAKLDPENAPIKTYYRGWTT